MRRITIMIAALVLAMIGIFFSVGSASAASCFAGHQPGEMPWKFDNQIRATGLVTCSSSVTMNATVELSKNGTIVATHTDHVTASSWAPFTSFSPDPAGLQTYCERSRATWSGGSTVGSWQCNLF